MSKVAAFNLGLVCGWLITCIGWAVGTYYRSAEYKAEAIKRGFAEYHATTGEWQWKEVGDE